jgi:hypothetical protein
VQRVTALKFPAAQRKNVYRDRPSHEQAEAFRRIGEGFDVEKEELTRLLAQTRHNGRKLRDILKIKLSKLRQRVFGYEKGVYRARRRFKGLPAE